MAIQWQHPSLDSYFKLPSCLFILISISSPVTTGSSSPRTRRRCLLHQLNRSNKSPISPHTSTHISIRPYTAATMHSLRLSLVMCVSMAISVIGHPPVSHPRIRLAHSDANEVADLYAQFPNETPLHTTALMAHATAAPSRTRSGNEELKR